MKKIKIPHCEFIPVTKLHTPNKCKTCAYHVLPSEEEDEMAKWYWAEHPLPHQCHERQNGWACAGSVEQHKRLGHLNE